MIKIYLLRDPNTKEVKYVGKTATSLPERLVSHLHESYHKKRKQMVFKGKWILSLLEVNQIPIIELIEEVLPEDSSNREKYWIRNYEECCSLFNAMFSTKNFIHREDLHKKVFQYDLNGNFISEWKSLTEVESKLGIPTGNIIQSCKGKRKLGGKFIWRYYMLDKVNEYKIDSFKKPVFSYDFDGNFVKAYSSARETIIDGFNFKNVSQCCNGDKKSHCRLQWKFDMAEKISPYHAKKRSYET